MIDRKQKAICLLWMAAVMPVGSAAVTNPRVDRVDQQHDVISWDDPSPVSVYESDRPDASVGQSTLVSKGNADGRFMANVPLDRRHYFLLRDDKDGDIERTAERVLPLERGSNFRDLGGYRTADGRHVRWGLIYRSGATPLLSDHDIAYIRTLDLISMTDLRSSEERQLAPTKLAGQGVHYVAVDYKLSALPDSYAGLLTALAPQYRAIFQQLLAKKGPISYNCTAGQDRTGVATALILSALGVPRQAILEDYHLSTIYREPENEMPVVDPAKYPDNPAAALFAKARDLKPPPLYGKDGHSFLAELLDQIDSRYGSVEKYLALQLGVGPRELLELRATYLER
jgi:protein-tyrosine phosphatase